MLLALVGCNPISDWPQTSEEGTTPQSSGGPGAQTPVVSSPTTGKPADSGNSSAPSGGTTAGTAGAPMPVVPAMDAGSSLGAFPGAADAGTVVTFDASAGGDATADAAADAGTADGAIPDAGPSDAGRPDASSDGGCVRLVSGDAGLCPAYGCRTSLDVRDAMDPRGRCSANEALAVACEGRASEVAHQCTQDYVFTPNLSQAVSACVRRDPQLAQLSAGCLDCFVDEALCTLARCFADCTVMDGKACQTCRRQQCSAPLARCTGLPTP